MTEASCSRGTGVAGGRVMNRSQRGWFASGMVCFHPVIFVFSFLHDDGKPPPNGRARNDGVGGVGRQGPNTPGRHGIQGMEDWHLGGKTNRKVPSGFWLSIKYDTECVSGSVLMLDVVGGKSFPVTLDE